jgi:hypothetical protein
MIIPHPKGVQRRADAKALLRRQAANFITLDLLGVLVIGKHSHAAAHDRFLARSEPSVPAQRRSQQNAMSR